MMAGALQKEFLKQKFNPHNYISIYLFHFTYQEIKKLRH